MNTNDKSKTAVLEVIEAYREEMKDQRMLLVAWSVAGGCMGAAIVLMAMTAKANGWG